MTFPSNFQEYQNLGLLSKQSGLREQLEDKFMGLNQDLMPEKQYDSSPIKNIKSPRTSQTMSI